MLSGNCRIDRGDISGVLSVAVLSDKLKNVRERISGLNIVLRWLIILILLMVVIIVGNYGGNLEAGSFIYQGF